MSDPPRVNLAFQTHWCARHLEPFRERWPDGAEFAMLKLFDMAVKDPRIFAALPKTTEGKANTYALNAALLEFAPLCCFVGDESMRSIYAEAGKEPPSD